MAYKGSLVELLLFETYWVYEHVYNLGNHLVIQSRMSRTSTFWLARTEYRLVSYSSAYDLRTLGFTYTTRKKHSSQQDRRFYTEYFVMTICLFQELDKQVFFLRVFI